MLAYLASPLLFRAPKPATYTEDSIYPPITMVSTRLGCQIPLLIARPYRVDKTKNLVVFLSHANSEDLGYVALLASDIAHHFGCTVGTYDFSGYGISQHPSQLECPSEATVYADCEAAFDEFLSKEHVTSDCVIVWGRSLGCAASIHLAMRELNGGGHVAGVVLQSPFMSVLRLAMPFLTQTFDGDIFRNLDNITQDPQQGVGAPVFVIHGLSDMVVPPIHGRSIVQAVPEKFQYPPLFVPGAGHNDVEEKLFEARTPLLDYVLGFYNHCRCMILEKESLIEN